MIIAYIYPDAAPHFEKSHQHAVSKKGFVMAILSSVLKRTLKREERLMQINKNAQKYVL